MERGVAITGFMGVGKTTVGRRLAERLGWPFVDLDDDLIHAFGPIAEQFAAVGEPVFRARERDAVRRRCDGVRRVLALGGGAWIDAQNREALRAHYLCVALEAPRAQVASRLADDTTRPLRADWERLFEERAPIYAEAERCVDASGTVDATVDAIVLQLRGEPACG